LINLLYKGALNFEARIKPRVKRKFISFIIETDNIRCGDR